MSHKNPSLLAVVGFAALLSLVAAAPALAVAVAPPLGTAGTYAVLGTNSIPTSGTVTCSDLGPGTGIFGDVGTTGGSITNSPPCTITGTTDINLPLLGSVVTDFNNAYSALNSLNPTCDATIPTTSTVLPPGIYCSAAATTITGAVTFTLNGSATDVWVFKIGTGGTGALTTGDGFSVVLGQGAQACNVWWWTDGAATMTGSDFIGTVLSGDAITMTGGSWIGRAMATTDVTLTDPTPLTFAGCAPPSSITVNKNFVPDSAAPVSMALTCTSGTVTATPLNASEGSPAVFTVGGADLGATCTATEPLVPVGYTANQANCVNVPLDGSCTIVNTLDTLTTITVYKDFGPNSPATVPVSLACTLGWVPAVSPLNASEGSPAVFTVNGTTPGATCTATETVPTGYAAVQTNCVDVALNGSCTITNRLQNNAITVIKNFIPNTPATVPVALTCTLGGVPTASPLNASEASPAVFTVTGAGTGATCTATELVPSGYTADQTNCVNVPLGGTCTITNVLIARNNVPALSEWGMLMLVALLALTGLLAIRRFVV